MYLLINTSTDLLQIAITSSKDVCIIDKKIIQKAKEKQSEMLLPAIEEILDKKIPSGIICVIGPGSFTGIRIGITVANTLAYSWKIPIIGVSNLELLAYKMIKEFSFNDYFYHSFIDAGKNRFYHQTFEYYNMTILNKTDPAIIESVEIKKILTVQGKESVFIGQIRNSNYDFANFLNKKIIVNSFSDLLEPMAFTANEKYPTKIKKASIYNQLKPLYINAASQTTRKKIQI